MTKAEVIELVAVLMASYPAARFPPGTVAAYEQFLGDLELERARDAVAGLVKSSKFMPAIAEVVTAYEALAPKKPETSYRRFKPRDESGSMQPSELKSAVEDFLRKAQS